MGISAKGILPLPSWVQKDRCPMSGEGLWDFYKHEQQRRREARLRPRTAAFLAVREEGYEVEQKSLYHFRVNDRLDLYPIHNRWHDLQTQERGGAQDLAQFVKQRMKAGVG